MPVLRVPGCGQLNTPQSMKFDPATKGFIAEGIRSRPDDAGRKNYYPMMRLVARDSLKRIVATTTDIVLPVSDEMSCAVCHGSGKSAAARPAGGWVSAADPVRDQS